MYVRRDPEGRIQGGRAHTPAAATLGPPGKGRTPAPRTGVALATAAIAGLALGIFLWASGSRPPVSPAQGEGNPYAAEDAQISSLFTGEGVVHIRGIERQFNASGSELNRTNLELWYDTATGDARYQTTNETGGGLDLRLREGKTYSHDNPSQGVLSVHTSGEEDFSANGPLQAIYFYKYALSMPWLVGAC